MRFLKKLVITFMLVFIPLSDSVSASTGIGLAWLSSQVNVDNNYTANTKIATPLQSLSEMLNAMHLDGSGIPQKVVDQINGDDYNSTEHLSRKLAGNMQAGNDISGYLIKLLKHQTKIGSFGELEGFDGSVVDTAFAMEGLSDLQVNSEAVQYAIGYLQSTQNSNGSWNDGANEPSVYATAVAMHAIWNYRNSYNISQSIGSATSYLLSQKQADGSWGEIYLTALVTAVIIPTLSDKTAVSSTITFLQNKQGSDGSWEGDIYTTALVLQALLIESKPLANPDLGNINGRIVDSANNAPLAGINIFLKKDMEILSTVSGIDGSFSFVNLAEGTYKFTVTEEGYINIEGHLTVQQGQTINLGDIHLALFVAPTTGAIQGTIKDSVSGDPIEGVTVSAGIHTVLTDIEGNYQIDNIQPGDITIRVGKDGYIGVVANGTISAGTTSMFSPSLTSASSAVTAIIGKIVDSVSGAPLKANIMLSGANTLSISANDDGSYFIDNLNTGATTVSISLDAYKTQNYELTVVLNNTYDISPSLVPLSELSSVLDITVIDGSTMSILPAATIKLSGANTRIGTTNSNGKYTFENLDSGEVQITIERTGYSTVQGSLTLRDNVTTPLSITLFPVAASKAVIQGTVINAVTGEAIENATVSISGSNTGTQNTSAEGGYAFSNLYEGETTITIDAAGYTSKTVQTVVTADETLIFVHQLYPDDFQPAIVQLQVLDAVTNSAFAGLTVNVNHSGFDSVYTTDVDGKIEIGDIIGRNVKISISLSGFTTQNLDINVYPGETYNAGIVKLFRNGVTKLEADLFVRSIDSKNVATDPFTLTMHGNLIVGVANQGTKSASGVQVSAYFDRDNSGTYTADQDDLIASSTLSTPLEVGESETISIAVNTKALFKDNPISVWVDSADVVIESNEENNHASTGCLNCGDKKLGFTYTFNEDFDAGSSINVAHLADGQLQLDEKVQTFDVMWVAASAHGTIVKINTRTGEILGEYRTGPEGRNLNPSRTTVDNNGNVWAGNRNDDVGGRGSVVKIGLVENGQCVDRNGNGVIDTSTGLGDIKAWGSADTYGGVVNAADECILHYVRVNGTGVRHVTVDKENNVWVGGWGNKAFNVLDGVSGAILAYFKPSCGGYGGLIDQNGVLWSANNSSTLRYDTKGTPSNLSDDSWSCLNIANSYGLGLDGYGNIWNSKAWSHNISKIAPNGQVLGTYSTQGNTPTGLVVGLDNDVWVTNRYSRTIARLGNDGSFKKLFTVGGNPTGAAVDAEGKIWVSVYDDDQFSRIDPATNTIDMIVKLRPGARPYNYSDMTGSLLTGKPDEGTWAVTKDSGVTGTLWDKIVWTDYIPKDSNLTVAISVSEDGVNFSTPKLVSNGDDSNVTGRYININVHFTRASNEESPILYDLSVKAKTVDYSVSALKLIDNSDTSGTLSLHALIANAGLLDGTVGVKVSFYDGNPLNGGVLIGSQNISALQVGAYVDAHLDGILALSGADIYVAIDPENSIVECDEANNMLHIPYSPFATVGDITASTDQQFYLPYSDVNVQAVVRNPGSFTYDFTVKLQILDGQGVLVTELPAKTVSALAAGESRMVSDVWNTSVIINGSYSFRAILLDSGGAEIGSASAAFSIISSLEGYTASVITTTDKPSYHTTDTVNINNFVQNNSVNNIIEMATVTIEVINPYGIKVYSETVELSTLVPGSIRNSMVTYSFANAVEGKYVVNTTLNDVTGVVSLASSTTYNVIENTRLALQANVTAQLASLDRGMTQICTASITNSGTKEITDLATRGLVVYANAQSEVMSQTDLVSLATGESTEISYTIPTAGMELGEYFCIFQAEINGVWQTMAHDAYILTEPPIHINAQIDVGTKAPLLVLLDSPQERGWCLDIFSSGYEGHDPYGPHDAPLLVDQRAYLENLLSSQGYSYKIVDNAADFAQELRSGNYSTYALFNEYITLSSQILSEIREAVYRGDGLLFAGKHQLCNDELQKPLGLSFNLMHEHVTTMTINNTQEYTGGYITLPFEDKATRFRLNGAEALGSFEIDSGLFFFDFCPDDEKYALTRYQYKNGRGVFAAFDLLMQASVPDAPAGIETILLEALNDIQPDTFIATKGTVYPLHLSLVNEAIATQGQTITSFSDGNVTDAGGGTVEDTGKLHWNYVLPEGGTAGLDYWLKIPGDAGPIDIETNIYAGDVGAESLYATIAHTINIDSQNSYTLQDALNATSAVSGGFLNFTYDSVEYNLNKAVYYENHGDYAHALSHAIQAADCLVNISKPEADEIHNKLAHAIRVLSTKL